MVGTAPDRFPLPDSVQDVLTDARLRLGSTNEVLVGISTDVEDAKQRKLRAQTLTGRAIEQLDIAIEGRRGLRRVRVGLTGFAASRARAARRRTDDGRGCVVEDAPRS